MQELVHDIQWTPEKVARFWDAYSATSSYFSEEFGDSLLRYAERETKGLGATILDFGCGPGLLLEKLARKEICLSGCDSSRSSLEAASIRLQNSPRLKELVLVDGFPSRLESDRFDTVFFVETIEHILPDQMNATLSEVLRVTKPGGYIVVSTPNEEDLSRHTIVCPECSCRFHDMQHVRSWTASSLAKTMEDAGWQTVSSRPTQLSRNQWWYRTRAWIRQKTGRRLKHLVFVGRKPS